MNRDPHLVIEFADGRRVAQRMTDRTTIDAAWSEACDSGMFVGGETVQIGRARAFLAIGEPIGKTPVDWIGYRVVPQMFDDGSEAVKP